MSTLNLPPSISDPIITANTDLVIAGNPLANRTGQSLELLAAQPWIASHPNAPTRIVFSPIFS